MKLVRKIVSLIMVLALAIPAGIFTSTQTVSAAEIPQNLVLRVGDSHDFLSGGRLFGFTGAADANANRNTEWSDMSFMRVGNLWIGNNRARTGYGDRLTTWRNVTEYYRTGTLLRFELGALKSAKVDNEVTQTQDNLEDKITGATLTYTIRPKATDGSYAGAAAAEHVSLYRINTIDGDWKTDEITSTDSKTAPNPTSYSKKRGISTGDNFGARSVIRQTGETGFKNWAGGYLLGEPGKTAVARTAPNPNDAKYQPNGENNDQYKADKLAHDNYVANDKAWDSYNPDLSDAYIDSEQYVQGGSYESAPIYTAEWKSGEATISFEIPKEDVLSWINNPVRQPGVLMNSQAIYNNGLFMRSANINEGASTADNGVGLDYWASNATTKENRPTLTIHYNKSVANLENSYGNIEFRDQNNAVAKDLTLSQTKLTASTDIDKQLGDAEDLALIIAMYDKYGNLNSLKFNKQTVGVGKTTLSVSLEDLTQKDIEDSGRVKAMLWDMGKSMSPVVSLKTLERFVISEEYSTDNQTNYNATINQIRPDYWSYFYFNGTFDTKPIFKPELLKPDANGWWHTDTAKVDNWLIKPSGETLSEVNREIIWNYTIGEETAGKDLKIMGDFSNRTGNPTLTILKTDDADSYAYSVDPKSNLIYQQTGDGKFEVTIAAEEAGMGNDIMFIIDYAETGYKSSILDITIERQNVASYEPRYRSPVTYSMD